MASRRQEMDGVEVTDQAGDLDRVVPGEVLEQRGPRALPPRQVLRRGTMATVVGAILWGISGTCAKVLMDGHGVDPLWLVAVRQLIAGCLLLILSRIAHPGAIGSLIRDRWALRTALVCALTGLGLNSVGYLMAVKATDSGTATVLQTLSIVIMLVVICIRTHRLPRKAEWLGLVLALVGTVLVATHGDPTSLHIPPEGLAWGLVSAVGATIMGIVNRPVLAVKGAMVVVGLEMACVGTCLTLACHTWTATPSLDGAGLALLAFTVVVGTVMAYGLYFQGVRDVGAYRAGLIGTIEPVTATVATVIVMGTGFSAAELVGFAMILATVLFCG